MTSLSVATLAPFLHERKDYTLAARVCENAEMYEEMSKIMAALIQKYAAAQELDVEERNLFSIANKNRVGALRASWRSLSADEHRNDQIVSQIKATVEAKMVEICAEVNGLCTQYLLVDNASSENKLFFFKMVGDYNRYLAEFMNPNSQYATASGQAYAKATQIARDFQPTNPVRLGLALNYSTYYYEITKDAVHACHIAKQAFDDAIAKLDELDDSSYKDATLILQLLRDNLTLWASDNDDEQGG